MCSIIGYVGKSDAAPILVKSLHRMEYRGYDSVGVATHDNDSICMRKGTGRVQEVNDQKGLDALSGVTGLGHTRWATHGAVTDINAHPHMSSSGDVAIVHNGVVENHETLRDRLKEDGYTFASETDSEVIANLLQYHKDITGDIKESLVNTIQDIQGHYAFIAMFDDGTMVSARYGEPLIVGMAENGIFLSSDVLGFIEHTDEAIYLESGMCCMIQNNDVQIMDYAGNVIKHRTTTVSKEFGDTRMGEYANYTLKEIHEQPNAILRAGMNSHKQIEQVSDMIRSAGFAYATGSGTSYNAALIGQKILRQSAGIRLEVILSSEMSAESDMLRSGDVLLAISQSGESADVLDAVRIAKEAGCVIVCIVNSVNSSLAKTSDVTLLMDCGQEIGVAATKSFMAQCGLLLRLVDTLTDGARIDHNKISHAISDVISNSDSIRDVAYTLGDTKDVYVLGRGIHHSVALEAALKIKELTYIHAEGLNGGEMKHGPLALIDKSSVVIVMNPHDNTYNDMLLGAREVQARGGTIIGVSDKSSDVYDHWIGIPSGDGVTYSLAEVVVSQLLAYYAALARDINPDYPRNLAKSVTVK